ncbi:hypothetical protein [Bacillus sp. FJAT-29814]|uniref:hypothetical protein n=1 Tax=Bacillus sp. FJAT-29814 TaxID=1729688 RepID=UPI0008310F8D|nr:hypothetical protein [Bacillus sp. FJAT-29814]
MLNSTTDYQKNIYANGRQINARITFNINGSTNVYDDTVITQLTILEEMSTLNDSIPSNELQVTLDNTSSNFNFLNLSNMHQIIAQRPKIFIELGLVLPNGTVEWEPMGSFYLDDWKNDVGAMTVTLIAYDNFTMLGNIPYGGPGVGANMTLYDIAVDIFRVAGITDYTIDQSLKNYTTSTGFKEAVTCRVALQHIGIAGMCAVFQDRNGIVQIKPFATIDSAGNYMTYAGDGLYAGFDPFDTTAYAKMNDGNGMKRLDLENMYTVPEITLGKSIYQLIIKVYASVDESTDYSKVNIAIAGKNGESFTIDNPLINTIERAQMIADWFILESNFNVVYKANWRGNPVLECADIVIISNGIDTDYAKQGRIYKQEYQYQGYLTCQTESRGGL